MRLIKDSCGRKSWHLTLAVPALIAGTVWFLMGGIDITLPTGHHVLTATKSGSDYLLFVTPWLSALGWRDYINPGRKGYLDARVPTSHTPPAV